MLFFILVIIGAVMSGCSALTESEFKQYSHEWFKTGKDQSVLDQWQFYRDKIHSKSVADAFPVEYKGNMSYPIVVSPQVKVKDTMNYILHRDAYKWWTAVVKSLHDSLVISKSSIDNFVRTADNYYIAPQGCPMREPPINFAQFDSLHGSSHIDSACILLHSWPGYFHVMFEGFFVVSGCRFLLESDKEAKVIIGSPDSAAFIKMLSLVGINADRIVVLSGQTPITVKKLYYPSSVFCGNISPGLPLNTREWIIETNRAQKIYPNFIVIIDRRVQRRNGCDRCLDNTDEMVSAVKLAVSEYEVVVFEPPGKDQPMKPTVDLFSNAAFIIAPHGAGLSNMIFAPKTASVLEIHNGDGNLCFASLARSLEIRYFAVHAINSYTANISDVIFYLQMAIDMKNGNKYL